MVSLDLRGWLVYLKSLSEQRSLRAAFFVWAVYVLILAIIVAVQPDIGLVMKIYRSASAAWWQAEPIYVASSKQGFLYLPQAAMILTPLGWFTVVVGEMLWRALIVLLFAWSIWRLAGLFGSERRNWRFLVMTVVGVVGSLSAARYGQTNVPLAAFLALAAVSLARSAWNSSALWLLHSLVSKPVGMVPRLLAGACYPRKVILPLVCGVVLLGALSFVHPNARYVEGAIPALCQDDGTRLTGAQAFVLRCLGHLPDVRLAAPAGPDGGCTCSCRVGCLVSCLDLRAPLRRSAVQVQKIGNGIGSKHG